MEFLSILIISLFGFVLSDIKSDEEHNQLHKLAANIMQNLQKDHLPNDGSGSGAPNAPLHHLESIGKNAMNSETIDKTTKTKITVEVKGIKFVSVEQNGKVVNISTDFGVGAVALFKIDKEEEDEDENSGDISDEGNREIDDSLNEYLCFDSMARTNETKIVLKQKARFDMKIEAKGMNKSSVNVNVEHGYVVIAKTNVTKGFNY